MSMDSHQQDSRIGPAVEDSSSDLEADLGLQSQPGRSRRDAADSQFQTRRRSSSRTSSSRTTYMSLAILLLVVATGLLLWKGRAASTKPHALPSASVEGDLTTARSASTEGALAAASTTSPTAPAASQTKTFIATVQDVFSHVKSNADSLQGLLDGQKTQQATLTKLEHDVGEIAVAVSQMKQTQRVAAAPRAPARTVAKAPASPTVPAAALPQRAAQLLAVDIWDGKPSVVIGTTDASDRVRFLREGDQQNGVIVKQADARRQRAVFDIAGRDVEMQRDATN
ncbi:MAG: hypothetical protein JF606_29305 [Burkholderiales bacterium]|nr:hypothetical protein [Burkholderiales bacterium]